MPQSCTYDVSRAISFICLLMMAQPASQQRSNLAARELTNKHTDKIDTDFVIIFTPSKLRRAYISRRNKIRRIKRKRQRYDSCTLLFFSFILFYFFEAYCVK